MILFCFGKVSIYFQLPQSKLENATREFYKKAFKLINLFNEKSAMMRIKSKSSTSFYKLRDNCALY